MKKVRKPPINANRHEYGKNKLAFICVHSRLEVRNEIQ
jgi:hypothetical protein